MSRLYRFADYTQKSAPVHFTRSELNRLLGLYGRNVAAGEWRDYAINQRSGCAVFAVFRSTNERPLYMIAKHAAPGSGPRFVVIAGDRRLREGSTIDEVLSVFSPTLRVVSTGPTVTPR